MSFSDNFPYVKGISEKFGLQIDSSLDEIQYDTFLDYDLYYLYLADAMMSVPSMVEFVKNEYELNKFTYYDKASSSSQYFATLISDGRIAREVLAKRAFGMLLASLDDESLRLKFCNLFIDIFPPLKKLKKPFTSDLYIKLNSRWWDFALAQKWQLESQRAFELFAPYVVDHFIGISNNKSHGVVTAKLCAISLILHGEKIDRNAFLKQTNIINARNYVKTPAAFREFKSLIKDSSDIRSTLDILRRESKDYYSRDYENNKSFAAIYDYLNDPQKKDTQVKFEISLRNISDALRLAGKDLQILIDQEPITEEELDLIYKRTAKNYQFAQDSTKRLVDIHPSDYFSTIIIYQIAKVLKADADFFYKNSAETQFNEMKIAQRENVELRRQLSIERQDNSELQSRISLMAEQITALTAELIKDEKDATRDATKPLLAEISSLNNQIARLQEEVEENRRTQSELYRLREFVFDMQKGNDLSVEEISLDNLIEGKRIYIFGGHTNWRIKIKQKYPDLEVLDGHNTSFNEQMLLGANLVLMNTSNMSHSLYYKIIDVLRKNNIPFGYIGKYSNPLFFEKEIQEILLRH